MYIQAGRKEEAKAVSCFFAVVPSCWQHTQALLPSQAGAFFPRKKKKKHGLLGSDNGLRWESSEKQSIEKAAAAAAEERPLLLLLPEKKRGERKQPSLCSAWAMFCVVLFVLLKATSCLWHNTGRKGGAKKDLLLSWFSLCLRQRRSLEKPPAYLLFACFFLLIFLRIISMKCRSCRN